jgi:hypothetical protein
VKRTYVLIATVQNCLVTPNVLADGGEDPDHLCAEALALSGLPDGDVLDMSNHPEPTQEFTLDECTGSTDYLVSGHQHGDNHVVCPMACAHRLELRSPCFRPWVADLRQCCKCLKVSALVVVCCQWSQLHVQNTKLSIVAAGCQEVMTHVYVREQLVFDLLWNEVGREEQVELRVGRERHGGGSERG